MKIWNEKLDIEIGKEGGDWKIKLDTKRVFLFKK